MIKIIKEVSKKKKQEITLDIMNALTEWFGPKEDIEKKSLIHRDYTFFAVYYNKKPIGFAALKIHNKFTIDIYNMGILEEYQLKGIGKKLLIEIEKYCKKNNFKYLTVKTLDSSCKYKPYEKTRSFYKKAGFIPLEVFKNFWNEDNPCLFMVKNIE